MTSKTITSQRAIAKALSSLSSGDRVQITWKPLTDAVWITREDDKSRPYIADSGANGLGAYFMSDVINGIAHVCEFKTRSEDGDVCFNALDSDGDTIDDVWCNSTYIASMRVLPAPTSHQVDGLEYEIVLHPEDGRAVIGCQTITRKGLEQIHDLLTKHLGRG